ncbi:MAG: GCN5-related N-acetyltransferase [Candidatus Peribacteria bacterium]|nr:GCN5-related N-acetyltransferase [Candidatus Peribacteria bacterium]
MSIAIREYRDSDFESLVSCMRELQEHIAATDSLHYVRSGTDYDDRAYWNNVVAKVQNATGAIYVAEDTENIIVGCIAGIIPEPSYDDLLVDLPMKAGIILEMYVAKQARRMGLGVRLMKSMELYFQKQKCDVFQVDCFAPNVGAHTFYEKCGYKDRMIIMMKKV